MPHNFKYGRKPRIFLPQVPHYSALIHGVTVPPAPASCNYLPTSISDFGMMLNDQLGDCTIAAIYHAIQIWHFNAGGVMETNPDSDILQTYEQFCGYNPSNPATDQGGVEQDVLADWLNLGVPVSTEHAVNKLAAWIEVDPRNQSDIEHVIYECAVCYIGFMVPGNIFDPTTGDPSPIWTLDRHAQVEGGHAVAVSGYDAAGLDFISWGKKYRMTWDFFRYYTQESYALVDTDWVSTTGMTPLGMDLQNLIKQMQGLRSHHH